MNPSDPFKALSIARNNVISVLGLAVEQLLEKSYFEGSFKEYLNNVSNILTILEHIVYFCAKGNGFIYSQKMKNHPWKLFQNSLLPIANNSISTIKGLDSLTNDFARLRALFRMGLMEKRLHEYFSSAFSDKKLNSKFYSPNSIILSVHLPTIINQIVGLSVVDFVFDLKSNLNHCGFYPIAYSDYLTLHPGSQHLLANISECNSHHDNNSNCSWREKYELVLTKAKTDYEQKGYLEEIVLNRDSKILALERRNEIFITEMNSLENSVTDLQIQLTLLHEQYSKEIEKLGGDSSLLSVPSVKSVIGSRADVLSNRHPLTYQFSQIDASITLDIFKENNSDTPLPQMIPFSFTNSVQEYYTKLSKMATSTGDLRCRPSGMSPTEENLTNNSKIVVGKQLISNTTQRFYSPKTRVLESFPANGTKSQTKPINHENSNSDYSSRLFLMKCDEQRTRIMESQNLRRIMGQACWSPMIKAHQRYTQNVNLPKSQSFDLTDSYSLDEISVSFNCSNSCNGNSSPNSKNNITHSPEDEENYYRLYSISAFEELIDDNFFDDNSSQIHDVPQPSFDSGEGSRDLPPPESVRLFPLMTAEVPRSIEPLELSREYDVASSHFVNGDRGSRRSTNSRDEL